MACFMGFVAALASKAEVVRVSAVQRPKLMNAVAKSIVQTAKSTGTPLHDAGLNGTGEVIQVRMRGYDEGG